MSPDKRCNVNPTDIMNTIYEIVSVLQTLQTLIKQLNQMCLSSFFRYLFSIVFFFAPQLNPFVWADAYAEAVKHGEEVRRAAREATGHQASTSTSASTKASTKASGRETVPASGVDGSWETRKVPSREYDASAAL